MCFFVVLLRPCLYPIPFIYSSILQKIAKPNRFIFMYTFRFLCLLTHFPFAIQWKYMPDQSNTFRGNYDWCKHSPQNFSTVDFFHFTIHNFHRIDRFKIRKMAKFENCLANSHFWNTSINAAQEDIGYFP